MVLIPVRLLDPRVVVSLALSPSIDVWHVLISFRV